MMAKTSFQALFFRERATLQRTVMRRCRVSIDFLFVFLLMFAIEQPEQEQEYEYEYEYEQELSSCAPRAMPITVPRPMRFSPRTCVTFAACACLIFVCSCEKHHVGEMPEVQREHVELGTVEAKTSGNPRERSTSSSPSPTLTPAEFFPTKPR